MSPYDLADLTQFYGLEFEEKVDDLDRYRLAASELANGEQVWITQYEGDRNPGAVAYADAGSDVEDSQSLLLQALGLESDPLLWTAPRPVLI